MNTTSGECLKKVYINIRVRENKLSTAHEQFISMQATDKKVYANQDIYIQKNELLELFKENPEALKTINGI
jgi:hypothetical protein